MPIVIHKWSIAMRPKTWSLIVAAFCLAGGFLVGTSTSQESREKNETAEIGRYQIAASERLAWIIDTKTGHTWRKWQTTSPNSPEGWEESRAPWDAKKK
ncbi:MAG TPA: hypothetical protein VKU82_15705 [Planctomycetaceae bacterium]|nr:hypothetical protein [Planctomycetaceae bacterium]